MSQNLSYIVMHPKRTILEISALTLSKPDGLPNRSSLKILADAVEGNHDPCVLTHPWFYTYCHATQLRRSDMGPGSMIFFLDYETDAFDTVFVVRRKHMWTRLRPRRLPLPIPVEISRATEQLAWELHFKWPSQGWHPGAHITFEATHWPAQPYSFVPVSGRTPLSKDSCLSPSTLERLKSKYRGKRPVPLRRDEAQRLYKRLQRQADVCVIDGIQLTRLSDIVRIGKDPYASC